MIISNFLYTKISLLFFSAKPPARKSAKPKKPKQDEQNTDSDDTSSQVPTGVKIIRQGTLDAPYSDTMKDEL